MELLSIFASATNILDVTSAVLAAITAYLYFWLPNVQDSHGTCIFHFSLNIAFIQAFLLFYEVDAYASDGYSTPAYCFTTISVILFLVVAIHVWSVILSYNTWKEIKHISIVSEIYPTRTLNCYRYLGYGVPSFFAVLMIIYMLSWVFRGTLIHYCFIEIKAWQTVPSIFSVLPNIFYFADSQRRLWNLFTQVQNENNPPSRSSMTALKYKMFLNLKLCLTMNIPFSLSSLIFLIVVLGNVVPYYSRRRLEIISYFVTSIQGTLIFLVAVAFRKRVIKGFIKYGDKSALGFIRVPECLRPSSNDDVEETDDDTGVHPEEERGAAPLQSAENEDGTQIRFV